jgi:hypothetical protein
MWLDDGHGVALLLSEMRNIGDSDGSALPARNPAVRADLVVGY